MSGLADVKNYGSTNKFGSNFCHLENVNSDVSLYTLYSLSRNIYIYIYIYMKVELINKT